VRRALLLQLDAILATIITAYGVIRAIVLLSEDVGAALRVSGFIATIGVAVAAATVGFYAARESFLKEEGKI
jgi:hypothetical protein